MGDEHVAPLPTKETTMTVAVSAMGAFVIGLSALPGIGAPDSAEHCGAVSGV
jgi:hypothetical protein